MFLRLIGCRCCRHAAFTQLPLTGAAGITMLVVVALLIGGAAALIAVRSHSLKQQLRG